MKVYRISIWACGSICLLILLLPVSRHWALLTTGERTTGTVTAYAYRMVDEDYSDGPPAKASEIEFYVEGELYKTYGPANYEYRQGRRLAIFYKKNNPDKNCVAAFSAFYLSYYTAIPIVLLIVWYAFYLSFNNYRKKMKMPGYRSGPDKDQPSRKAFKNSGIPSS